MNFGSLSRASFPVQFSSPIGGMEWAVLAGIPVGIIALYFLKLRRRPVQVASTLLWRRSLEDLHVNSLFQRLRKNLLLFLQLLAIVLAMLALAGPKVKGTSTQGQRYVLTIDNSASMSATDVKPSRLARAKEEAKKLVDAMESDDLAMVITFSDRARVVSNYTGDRNLLRSRIDGIAASESSTSLREALEVSSGLANPAKQFGEGEVATSVVPPKLMIYTDGGFSDVEGFSLGNLEPQVVVIGPPPPPITDSPELKATSGASKKNPSDNLAILALQTRRNDDKPDQYQVFGRVHNYRAETVSTEAQLLRLDPKKPGSPGALIDAIALKLGPKSDQSFKFELPDKGRQRHAPEGFEVGHRVAGTPQVLQSQPPQRCQVAELSLKRKGALELEVADHPECPHRRDVVHLVRRQLQPIHLAIGKSGADFAVEAGI
ncbi:VWA domain-containing protein [Singulisphaera rosea]